MPSRPGRTAALTRCVKKCKYLVNVVLGVVVGLVMRRLAVIGWIAAFLPVAVQAFLELLRERLPGPSNTKWPVTK